MTIALILASLIASQVAGVPLPPPRDTPPPAIGTGVIRGRVVAADTARPLPRAVVNLMGPQQQRTAQTDADGRYAFQDLPAGTYTVTADGGQYRAAYLSMGYGGVRPDGAWINAASRSRQIKLDPGERRDDVDIRLQRAAAITGQVVDGSGEPVARISVRALRLQRGQRPTGSAMAMTDDLGQYRIFGLIPGDYVVYSDSRSGELPRGLDGEPRGFGPTYAPATSSLAQAARVRLGVGGAASIDLQLIETRLYSISGVVATSTGEPPRNSGVMAVRADIETEGPVYGAAVSPSGTFTVSSLPPGSYDLHVRHSPEPANPATQEHTIVRVEVSGADVSGIALVTAPGATVSGEIVFDDGVTEGRTVSLSAQATERRMFGPSVAVDVKDSAFTLKAVFSPVVIRGWVRSGQWSLRAVLLDGRDITDVPTLFSARDSGRLQVVFTNRAPTLEGTVDTGGVPFEDCVIVAFGEDPATWTSHSMAIRIARANAKGAFMLPGLREGNYLVVAIPSDVGVPMNPPDVDLLEQLKKVATPVVLNLGERRRVDLGLVRVER